MENWEKFLKEAECPPGCEPAQGAAPSAGAAQGAAPSAGAAQGAAPSAGVSDGSFAQTIQTISRKDNARLRAFLSIVAAAYPNTPAASKVAIAFDKTKDTNILSNLPQGNDLPGDLAKLVAGASRNDRVRKFLQGQVQMLFKKYQQNPQLLISTT